MIRFFPFLILFLFSFLGNSPSFGMKEDKLDKYSSLEDELDKYPLLNETGKERREKKSKTSTSRKNNRNKKREKTGDIIAYLKRDISEVPEMVNDIIERKKVVCYTGRYFSADHLKFCTKFFLKNPDEFSYNELIKILAPQAKRIKLSLSFLDGIGLEIAKDIIENKFYTLCNIDDITNNNVFNVALKDKSISDLTESEQPIIRKFSKKKNRYSFSSVSFQENSTNPVLKKIKLSNSQPKRKKSVLDPKCNVIGYPSESENDFQLSDEIMTGVKKMSISYSSTVCGSPTIKHRIEFTINPLLNTLFRMIKALVEQNAKRIKVTTISFDDKEEGIQIAQSILEQNLHKNCLIHDKNNETVLHHLFRDRNLAEIKNILSNPTRMFRSITSDGNTVLHCLFLKESNQEKLNSEIIKAIYKSDEGSTYKADTRIASYMLNYQNNDGDTPFHLACRNFDYHSLKLLLKKGVKINIMNEKGELPLDILFRKYASLEKEKEDTPEKWALLEIIESICKIDKSTSEHVRRLFDIMAKHYNGNGSNGKQLNIN